MHTGLLQVSSDVRSAVKEDNFSFSPVLTFSQAVEIKLQTTKIPVSNSSCLE